MTSSSGLERSRPWPSTVSNRLLIWTGASLILFGGLALLLGSLPLTPEAEPGYASLVIHANNAGVRLAPDDGRVYVYTTGSTEHLVAEGTFQQPLAIPRGRYDVRALFSRSRDQQSIWLRDTPLTAGEQAVHKIEFSAGEINIEATVGAEKTKQGQVVVYVFMPNQHDEIITSMGAGEPALLTAGAYDVRVVWAVDSEEKEIRWFHNVQVKVGLQSKLKVPFDRGSLIVHARNAGAPLEPGRVLLTVYRAGDLQEQVLDSGLAGNPLDLATGLYDVRATFTGSHDKPSRWLRGVEIRDGAISEQTVEFSSGMVVVDAEIEGGPALSAFEVYIYYYRVGDHQQVVTYTPAGDTTILESGRYDMRALFFRANDQPDIWRRDFAVNPGATVEHKVSFPSGKLLVRAYDHTGAELIGDNVFIYVYPASQRVKPVAVARSGEVLILTAGEYDIRAEDTRTKAQAQWLGGIRLQAGMLSEETVSF